MQLYGYLLTHTSAHYKAEEHLPELKVRLNLIIFRLNLLVKQFKKRNLSRELNKENTLIFLINSEQI